MEYEVALYSTASSGTLQTKKDIQLCYPKSFTQSTCLKQMQKYVVRTLNNPYIQLDDACVPEQNDLHINQDNCCELPSG